MMVPPPLMVCVVPPVAIHVALARKSHTSPPPTITRFLDGVLLAYGGFSYWPCRIMLLLHPAQLNLEPLM